MGQLHDKKKKNNNRRNFGFDFKELKITIIVPHVLESLSPEHKFISEY